MDLFGYEDALKSCRTAYSATIGLLPQRGPGCRIRRYGRAGRRHV